MIYVYDAAISNDLRESFDPQAIGTSAVKVVDPDMAVDVISQISSDEFKFPAVVVTRSGDYSIDTSRMNFTRLHRGVSTVIDTETNNLYDERIIPVSLSYNLTVLATNTADADELTRELLFKYYSMYFLTVTLPYESKRKVRFGLTVDDSQPVEQTSRLLDYVQGGKAYQTIIHLRTEGCVLVTYVPRKLPRYEQDVKLDLQDRRYRSSTDSV